VICLVTDFLSLPDADRTTDGLPALFKTIDEDFHCGSDLRTRIWHPARLPQVSRWSQEVYRSATVLVSMGSLSSLYQRMPDICSNCYDRSARRPNIEQDNIGRLRVCCIQSRSNCRLDEEMVHREVWNRESSWSLADGAVCLLKRTRLFNGCQIFQIWPLVSRL